MERSSSNSRENGQAVFYVRDDGDGIPMDQLGRVFDVFTQIEQSLERSGSGLSIGLALVRTLVELQGGTVSVASAGPGRGSEFVVRLPLGESQSSEASPSSRDVLSEAGAKSLPT